DNELRHTDSTSNAGENVLSFALGDSGVTATTIDTVTNFLAANDTLDFGLASGTANNTGNFDAATADFDTNLALAELEFAANSALRYVIYAYEDAADATKNESWVY